MKVARFEISVDLVPVVATASASAYTSSLLQDNCGWLKYGWQLLGIRTTVSRTFAQCGFNARTLLDDSADWSDLLSNLINPSWLYNQNKCEIDEVMGKSVL